MKTSGSAPSYFSAPAPQLSRRGSVALSSLAVGVAALVIAFPAPSSAADLDGDGMEDAWEASMGLNSTLPNGFKDAFSDLDGDRVPNLWEYARGTQANSPTSKPAFDATVDASQPSAPASARFATLQEAYDYLGTVSTDPNYRFLVDIKRGHYSPRLTGIGAPRKVAWIGERGADNASGLEGVVLRGGAIAGTGITLTDETVLDAVIIDGGYFDAETRYSEYEGVQYHYYVYDPEVPALTVTPSSGTPEVRLINCIVRDWDVDPNEMGYAIPGAMQINGGDVWLVHTTVYRACSWVQNLHPLAGQCSSIRNSGGTLNLANSIIHPGYTYGTVVDGIDGAAAGNLTIQTSVVADNTPSGAISTDPQLTWGGFQQRNNSSAVRNTGSALGLLGPLLFDVHGEARPPTTGIDIGADEWVNTTGTGETTNDDLPDWWEFFWFGNNNRAQTNTGNPDGDIDNNLYEYLGGTIPDTDQDNDGLVDSWEWFYWPNLGLQSPTGDPDEDGLNNLFEYNQSTDPTLTEPTADLDNDGLPDVWEVLYFGSRAAYDADDNPDGDARNNLQEYVSYTDPITFDLDADLDADGLYDVWELQYFNSTSAQTGADNLDGDGASNLLELLMGTNPNVADNYVNDVDADGWDDAEENTWFQGLGQTRNGDFDGDGLANYAEIHTYGTNPTVSDTNGDGLPDGLAVSLGLSATDPDPDGDGWSSVTEIARGTSPFDADTDGDGAADSVDPLPLDSTVSGGSGVSVAGPPVLSLYSPPGAVLLP